MDRVTLETNQYLLAESRKPLVSDETMQTALEMAIEFWPAIDLLDFFPDDVWRDEWCDLPDDEIRALARKHIKVEHMENTLRESL